MQADSRYVLSKNVLLEVLPLPDCCCLGGRASGVGGINGRSSESASSSTSILSCELFRAAFLTTPLYQEDLDRRFLVALVSVLVFSAVLVGAGDNSAAAIRDDFSFFGRETPASRFRSSRARIISEE
jgi:hypothetical protein